MGRDHLRGHHRRCVHRDLGHFSVLIGSRMVTDAGLPQHERGIRRFPSGGRQRRQRQQRAIGGRWRHALPIPPGMLAGALVSAERPPITGQVSPASGGRSGSSLGSRERVAGRPAKLGAAVKKSPADATRKSAGLVLLPQAAAQRA